MQCTKHKVHNVFVAGLVIQLCADMAADIGHFNPFYTIMHQLGGHIDIVYSEHAFLHSFAQYILKQQYLLGIKPLAHFLYPPNVAKEIGPKRAVTEYHLFHCVQTCVYHLNHLLVRRYVLLRHTLHHIRKHIQFRFDNMFDVLPTGWDKGSAALELARALGLTPDEVAVFGDSDNDLPMIDAVPNSVAVANANEAVTAAARWHIGAAADDAVAGALHQIAACAATGEMPSFMRQMDATGFDVTNV